MPAFWSEHLNSYRNTDISVQCRPSNILLATGSTGAVALIARYVTEFSQFVDLTNVALPVALSVAAAVSLLLSNKFKGSFKNLAGLFILSGAALHNLASLSLVLHSQPPAAYVFAGMLLFSSVYWGRFFAISIPGIGALAIVPSALALNWDIDLLSKMIVVAGGVLYVWSSWNTGQKRRAEQQSSTAQPLQDPTVPVFEDLDRRLITTTDISVWQNYVNSEDGDIVTTKKNLKGTVLGAFALAGAAAALGLMPLWPEVVSLKHPVAPILIAALAGLFGFASATLAEKHTDVSRFAGLLHTALMASAIALLSGLFSAPVGYGVGLAFVFYCFYWSRRNAFSALGITAIAVFPLFAVVAFKSSLAIKSIILIGGIIAGYQSWNTRQKIVAERRIARSNAMLKRLDALLLESRNSAVKQLRLEIGSAFHKIKNELGPALWNLTAASADNWKSKESEGALAEALSQLQHTVKTIEGQLQRIKSKAADESEDIWLPEAELYLQPAGQPETPNRTHIEVGEFPAVSIKGTEEDLRLILINLIDNALEAGSTRVNITSEIRSGGVEISFLVQDDGPGVPESLKAKIFSPFVTQSKPHGTGLGLYLSRRLAEGMGGRLMLAESTGSGATFELTLPINRTRAKGDSNQRSTENPNLFPEDGAQAKPKNWLTMN